MMILRARTVLPMDRPPIANGAVVVEGDTIVAVGPAQDIRPAVAGDVHDLGDVVLLPGLINAHCHLDYTRMKCETEWRGSFIEWLLQLVALKGVHFDKDYLTGFEWGLDQLAKSGTTTVVNVESFPQLIDLWLAGKDARPSLGLRIWWCLELIDFKREQSGQESFRSASEFIAAHRDILGGLGLSPHAPYSVSGELYRMAARYARSHKIPLTTHVAESQEEDDMIRRGTGHMYDYFLRAGRNMTDCKRVSPVQMLHEHEALGPNCLAVHANVLTPVDVGLLGQTGTHVVHCPKSHRFFNRDTPMIESLWQQGVNVCLGTDSLASNDSLNMFEEMRTLAQVFPRLAAEKILPLATTCAAKALNLGSKLGKIAPGAWADLIAVPRDEQITDPYEAVVYTEKPVCFSMVGGKVLIE